MAYKFSGDGSALSAVFKPEVPMHPQAAAVNNITPAMLESAEVFMNSTMFTQLQTYMREPDVILVAHNAPFDITMLAKEGIICDRRICTLKVWRWMDRFQALPKHKLQFLREHYGVNIDAKAHDALGDVILLEALFEVAIELLQKNLTGLSREDAILKMEDITGKALLLKKMPFGKHKGKPFSQVPKDYLKWIVSKNTFDSDILFSAQHYLEV